MKKKKKVYGARLPDELRASGWVIIRILTDLLLQLFDFVTDALLSIAFYAKPCTRISLVGWADGTPLFYFAAVGLLLFTVAGLVALVWMLRSPLRTMGAFKAKSPPAGNTGLLAIHEH